MEMTENEAKGFIQGKLDCMNKCNIFEREHSYNTDLCDSCDYCYAQGNFGNQKEAFSVAINALKKQEKIKEALEKGKKIGYNKALNDFVNACKSNSLCQTFGLRQCDINKIAKQLKAGGRE